ncbi:TonB-dependent receptor [Poseidonibacter lekithochrous]|uniref:TonB-dependent receptor domain-containing protein n=1 Tax=Poseidonibacter TaxID=2321187 RepID=UPI001C09F1D8|nr:MULTISPECIES: TonB-dependent receptor [Poseidonibacter]MBU3013959.1 TonB-dependent receptor [Poseidonibacter lekithochrous]MDO6827254.1 TonB-dependent receptor [Poseidonibacter sp. 1_MG-2023]
MKYIGLSIILPCYLVAQSAIVLDEIRIEEQSQRQTNSVSIDLEKEEQNQANSVFDLFKKEASVELGGGGSSNAKRVYVRGIESSTLNISLDGATQGTNIFQHRGNELGINPDILKVVKVKTSPDVSKGGSLGGSVEMTTKDAQDFVKNGKNVGGIVKAGYSTNTNSKSGSLTAYGVYDKHYGILASVSGVNSDNYEDGNNDEMLATAYKDRNYLLKLTLNDLNNHDLKLSFNQNSNSGDMQWGKTGSDKGLNVDPTLLENVLSTTTNYTLQHNYSNGNLLNLDTNMYFTNIEVDREKYDYQYDNDTVGVKLQNHFYLDTESIKNKISLGVQVEDEESTSNASVTSIAATPSHYAPISSNNKAVFIQNKTTINNLDINYGVRFDKYEFETGLGEVSDTTTSPNFGLDYKINENSNVYANYGQSSRMSGTIPFTWAMNIRDDTTYSKDLEAEKSTRYEIGYELRGEELFTNTDGFIFNANIFRTEVNDLITSYSGLTNASGKFSYSGEAGLALTDIYNSDYEYVLKGFEIKGSYFIDNYFASLSFSQVDTNVYDEKDAGQSGEPLAIRRVGGWDSKKVVLNLGAELLDGLSMDYTLTAVAGIDNADQVTRGGYTTHDISTKYQVGKKWTYYAAVTNLTNKYYAPHTTLSGSSDDDYRRDIGRDFKFSVKYEF